MDYRIDAVVTVMETWIRPFISLAIPYKQFFQNDLGPKVPPNQIGFPLRDFLLSIEE